jgi:hypothetical protein
MHPAFAAADTTRLKQLDAIRTSVPINLGWNGVSSVLTFKHQIGLMDGEYLSPWWDDNVDRGIVQIQVANSAGQAVGNWRKIAPYENVYDTQPADNYTNCQFDPTDDGNDEDDYFDPTHPQRRFGPSSTCRPEFAFSRLGAIFHTDTFDPTDLSHASDGPGLQGSLGPGTWVQSKFDLSRYRGRRLRLRFLVTSMEIGNAISWEQALQWDPFDGDDGWYIDDVQVTNTLVGAATVSVDTADRSALPACGPVCGSVSASLIATPPTIVGPDEEVTLDASGSAPDQCPGGTLHYRFWQDVDSDGVLDVDGANSPLFHARDAVLQEWGPGTSAIDVPNQEMGYGVDVRCSTRPACAGRASVVVALVCQSMEPRPFAHSVTWNNKVEAGYPPPHHLINVIRGDLDALRASGGQFDGTVQTCVVRQWTTTFTDETVPGVGQAFYYLVRDELTSSACTFGSWGTGSPAEVPGAGGNRDVDIPLDPDTCQPPN